MNKLAERNRKPSHRRTALFCLAVATALLAGCVRGTPVTPDSAPAAKAADTPAAVVRHVPHAVDAVDAVPMVALATAAPAPEAASQTITLHRNGAITTDVAVTLGIPFPPGMLQNADAVRILDEHGTPIPAHVEPVLQWHLAVGGVRAVQVQFHAALEADTRTLRFAIGGPAAAAQAGWPYADGEVVDADGVRVPGVLATLSPAWMAASMIAGPQQPAPVPGPYDRYFDAQFQWARPLPTDNPAAWLFDRPTTLFQQYVRTGRVDYLAAAVASYHFYMSHIRRQGAPGWPDCAGGFALGDKSPCDSKYVYIEPIKLALGLTGDDSMHDKALVDLMAAAWITGGWNPPAGPYNRADQHFTEREAGLGLLAIVNAWEITGEPALLEAINERIGWLHDHQQHNPDGLGNDGSWRSSWQVHEGATYNAATDVRGNSPWMSENIVDALWHAWLVTGDARIPGMLAAYGEYMEQYGWIDLETMRARDTDWRNGCSGPDGQISWYWSSSQASPAQLARIQDSEGWYSDAHDVELMLVVAAARYFSTDEALRAALSARLARLTSSYDLACARHSATPRRFNWNNRGVGVVQWFMAAAPAETVQRRGRPPQREHPLQPPPSRSR